MASIIDTTDASDNSDPWAPTGDAVIQMTAAVGGVTCTVYARADALAPWAEVGRIISYDPIIKITQMPELMVAMSGNVAGNPVEVWNNEA